MEFTQLGNVQAPVSEPATAAETEQLDAEFAGLLPGRGVRSRVRDAAHKFFAIGWVTGVRNGHTGPALTSVSLPRADVYGAFHWLEDALPGEDAPPVLRQAVRYHGSMIGRHGLLWVTGITATVAPGDGEEYRYELSERTGDGFRVRVSRVRACSITPVRIFG
ncbi:hypothetical protein [Streptomyces sp. NPDC058595]|uniref:hypothetical protein n=1 Tax=Streptomyces sp. NPDC058595 TaxID=3346550 RepID=UPI0036480CA2